MTNEQRGAIYRLGIHSEYAGLSNGAVVVNKIDLDTVLSLIKEYQQQLEKKDKRLNRQFKLLTKKDNEIAKLKKQIDLMADKLVEAHEWFYSEFDNYTKEDFIKYFADKAKTEQ